MSASRELDLNTRGRTIYRCTLSGLTSEERDFLNTIAAAPVGETTKSSWAVSHNEEPNWEKGTVIVVGIPDEQKVCGMLTPFDDNP